MRSKYQIELACRNPEIVVAVSFDKTVGRRDTAPELTWMYLQRVLSKDTVTTVIHRTGMKFVTVFQ